VIQRDAKRELAALQPIGRVLVVGQTQARVDDLLSINGILYEMMIIELGQSARADTIRMIRAHENARSTMLSLEDPSEEYFDGLKPALEHLTDGAKAVRGFDRKIGASEAESEEVNQDGPVD